MGDVAPGKAAGEWANSIHMVKAVFIESIHSHYADRPGEVYHFPNSYLSRVARTVGDWVIFYEGRRGDGKGYHRVQKVATIQPDPADATHSFAILDRGSALDFETNLPRQKSEGKLWESGLAWVGGNNTSSVRLISDQDFVEIINAGLSYQAAPDALPREGEFTGFVEAQAGFAGPLDQDRTRILSSRLFREQSFSRIVRRAYAGRCAISGLELRNGGGRPEVEAAHILPVAERGPDIVSNGLALSGTIHWMFDRGLLGVDGDHRILIARDSIADETVRRLVHPSGRIILPARQSDRPHASYLAWHRENCFKG